MSGKSTIRGFMAMGILLVGATTKLVLADSLTTIDFNGIPGNNASPFMNYIESGFTVASTSGSWLVGQNFGNPAPFIYFVAPPASTIMSSIAVTHGGSTFRFSSIDFYSSTTPIPYTFTGLLGNRTVFTVAGIVPNTFGNFATVINPDSTLYIDTLRLTLTNATAPCCDNPVGLDNIAMLAPSNVSIFATELDNPRGLKFGPDGDLYVAEGGQGGSDSTEGQCVQVVAPVGPYTGGKTAHISRVDASGTRTVIVDNLPSSQTSPASGSFVSGVADVAFLGDTLYAILAGAGCSHGVPDVPNSVIRVNPDLSWTVVADLSAFLRANPVANPNPGDFEPDGTWYSMRASAGKLYALEPNHGELDTIAPGGAVRRVVDISATQGHIVPTALAQRGLFFIGNLSTFPLVDGGAKVLRTTASGHILPGRLTYTGLTGVLGLAFDGKGGLLALETSAPGFPTPGTGRVLRLKLNTQPEVIATGLVFPTAMTFGPDGFLYVSNFGFGFPPGYGQVVRIAVPPSH